MKLEGIGKLVRTKIAYKVRTKIAYKDRHTQLLFLVYIADKEIEISIRIRSPG